MYYRRYDQLTTGEVTCAEVYLNILCLGTSTGTVRLFTLSDPVDLLRLDTLATVPVEHQVSQVVVTSVRLSVVSGSGDNVHLVMVTGDSSGRIATLTWRSEFTKYFSSQADNNNDTR